MDTRRNIRYFWFGVAALVTIAACSGASDAPVDGSERAGLAVEAPPDAPASSEPFTPPLNPHVSRSAWPVTHRDSYAQHHGTLPGVTGAGRVRVREADLGGVPLLLLDSAGRVVALSFTLRGNLRLSLLDPETLEVLARRSIADDGLFSGVYSYLDSSDRIVLASGRSVLRYRQRGTTFELDGRADLGGVLPANDKLSAVNVLYSGEVAFTTRGGCAGVFPESALSSAALPSVAMRCLDGERISNGFSLDETGGIFVVTDRALHRFGAEPRGLAVSWSVDVPALTGSPRPGRVGTGSGTTPSLLRSGYVVIADDALSMNLRVFERGTGREVCNVTAFPGEAATTENSIAILDDSMIAEQNLSGRRGVARFDLIGRRPGCRRVWSSDVWAPNGVPTLSRDSRLVYVYARQAETWGLAGLDFETGERRFFAPAGVGPLYDSLYSALIIGPDGRVFGGTARGVVSFTDEP